MTALGETALREVHLPSGVWYYLFVFGMKVRELDTSNWTDEEKAFLRDVVGITAEDDEKQKLRVYYYTNERDLLADWNRLCRWITTANDKFLLTPV